jgi:hypothetical protein
MENKKRRNFQELKAEYSRKETTESRKKELVKLMQENLKQRCGQDGGTIKCLDGKNYSIDSNDVSELYAIDFYLNELERKKKVDNISEKARKDAEKENKYSLTKTYTGR